MTYKEEISKEELFELPLKQFDGEVLVFNQKRGVDKAVKYLSKFPFIGFDTETRPSFKKGQINKVALLHLSTNDKAFLFRINQFELPKSLLNLLSNPKIIKAGAAIRDDVRTLQINSFFEPGGFFELQDEAKRLRINNFSLKKLSGIVLGHKISKAQQLSNWEAPELSEAQLRYAATDAWVSYKIYEDFNKNSNE
ncbi:MAG: 3'-5' exonuclease domain-containing protein 2 [Prolixibacteraceae bacterium]|jgi:ribonuclease D|nr:3'-5' exonuclease domain-containing protein 2 [Prolixibacteraceae bacterium]